MIREITALTLAGLLVLGTYSRCRLIIPSIKHLSSVDKLREWAGLSIYIAACLAICGLFWQFSTPMMGGLALAVMITFNLTAPKQFPIFK